jgi:8-amino-7-oxononanoate synthase
MTHGFSPLDDYCTDRSATMQRKGLSRSMSPMQMDGAYIWQEGMRYLNFSSNDYLGIAATLRAHGNTSVGAGASRLVSGSHPLYAEIEQTLAAMKGTESALLFGSGYLANIGAIAALVGKSDVIIADKYAHACMIDGAQLSGATLHRYRHNDMAHLEALLTKHRSTARHCLILTETVFSMEGTRAPVQRIADLAKQHRAWLMTDDAHGFGLPSLPNPAPIQLGTLSKAAGCYGGYVCGSAALIEMLKHYARSVMFSTALPEVMLRAIMDALHMMNTEPDRAGRVMASAQYLCEALHLSAPQSAIVPIILGSNEDAVSASSHLKAQAIAVPAIRPPTVPQGTARLRICVTALHEQQHLDALIEGLKSLL